MSIAHSNKPPLPPSSATANGGIGLSLLKALEKSQKNPVEVLDIKTVKKLVLAFERRLKENIAEFADSESPEFYPELVNLDMVVSITSLLNHENTNVAIDVVGLLQDLTDEDVLADNDEPTQVLVDVLVENNALDFLVQLQGKMSDFDPDESTAIYRILATVEDFIEVKPSVAELVCERTKLMKWLLTRIKVREFDGNKQYASEILAILLRSGTVNQKKLGQLNGVDALLQVVAMYKSKDPKTPDEEEMVENFLFETLCCLLMPLENNERFVGAKGVKLKIIMMNQKKMCYGSGIRALDFAMTNYPPVCERFVDVMGLKTAFPAFMATSEQKEQEALQRRTGRAQDN